MRCSGILLFDVLKNGRSHQSGKGFQHVCPQAGEPAHGDETGCHVWVAAATPVASQNIMQQVATMDLAIACPG